MKMKGFIAQVYVTKEDGLIYINNYGDCKGISDAFFLTTEELIEIKDNLLGMEEDDAIKYIAQLAKEVFDGYWSLIKSV